LPYEKVVKISSEKPLPVALLHAVVSVPDIKVMCYFVSFKTTCPEFYHPYRDKKNENPCWDCALEEFHYDVQQFYRCIISTDPIFGEVRKKAL
jgi:hypothetical protein